LTRRGIAAIAAVEVIGTTDGAIGADVADSALEFNISVDAFGGAGRATARFFATGGRGFSFHTLRGCKEYADGPGWLAPPRQIG